jgi:hypothetical protein
MLRRAVSKSMEGRPGSHRWSEIYKPGPAETQSPDLS